MTPTPTAKLISDREFVVEHVFRAPAAKIFAAYTDPKMLPKWWGLGGGSIRVDAMDVRPGGEFRFVQRMPNGHEIAFHGTYLEVRPVTRLVYTHATDGRPGEIRATVELREEDGVTHLTLTTLCPSTDERDTMMRYGAAAGAQAVWKQLEELLSSGGQEAAR